MLKFMISDINTPCCINTKRQNQNLRVILKT